MKKDNLIISKRKFNSRLIVGTGKYKNFKETAKAIKASGADMVTVAVRRVNIIDKKPIDTYRKNNSKENKLLTNKQEMPPVSSFNELEIDNNFLVKGEGQIYGTIACFQMLSNLLDFPFRRDSVEKVLNNQEIKGLKK